MQSVEELDDDDIDAIAAVRKDFSHMARSFALDARRSMGKLMTVFRKYDKSGDGNINMDELEPLMVELLNWPAGQDARLQKASHG